MPGSRSAFSYVVLALVPSAERGERLNVAVVVFCRQRGFLGMSTTLDERRLRALGDGVDVERVAGHLGSLVRVAEGAADAGPIAALPPSDRFGWLAAPSSTIVQPSAVHTGLTDDPASTLGELHARLVA